MPKKLNILYHHRTQGRGAEGVHIMSIVRALEALGHSVTIVSPPGINPVADAGNAPVDKAQVNTKGINSVWKFISKFLPNILFELVEIIYNIPSMRNLERHLSENSYDLIYERYAFYMISGALKASKYNIPLILEANEVSGIKNRARKQSLPWLCGRFEKILFNRCASIHTVSSYLKSMIVDQGIDAKFVQVTPNAIDPEKFNDKIDNMDLKRKYKTEDKLVIGFAGWFDYWDRLDLLFGVFEKLKKRHDNLVLLLIGEGAVLNEVRCRSKSSHLEDSVILTGAVDRSEVHKYLSLLDIAVITHSNDFGSPVVMFEFMGLKIPVVAPKLGPVTDIFNDLQQAILFEVMDMDDLERKLEDLILDTDLQASLATKSYKLLIDKHTWHNNAKAIVAGIAD